MTNPNRAEPTPIDRAEDQVVRRASQGDPAATEALLAEFRPQLVRYCRARLGRLGGTYTTADDVAQEICIGILRALPRYQDQGKPFAAFVFTIAARKVVDAQRAAARANAHTVVETLTDVETLTEQPDTAPGPEQRAVDADLARRAQAFVHPLLEELQDVEREIVVLRIGVGLTAEQVGAVLGMTAAAVRMSQSRAIYRLRKMVAEHRGEVPA